MLALLLAGLLQKFQVYLVCLRGGPLEIPGGEGKGGRGEG